MNIFIIDYYDNNKVRTTSNPQTFVTVDTLYTDGSCIGNPGPGGWGVVNEKGVVVGRGRNPDTTNNEMELTAILGAATLADPEKATLILTDCNLAVGYLNKGHRCKEPRLILLTIIEKRGIMIMRRNTIAT